jgi:ribonuclease G
MAILEDRRLVELQQEETRNEFSVGDIFLGKVSRILPGLNAVFVDIGYSRDAFLHYLDLGPQIRTQNIFLDNLLTGKGDITKASEVKAVPDINKHGKMADVLKPGQTIIVQIMKEAISSKGPRLSSQLSIAGQYLILMPFSSDVAVSRKISSQQQKRAMKKMLQGILDHNFGLIVRTAADGVDFEKLKAEYYILMDRWEQMTRGVIGSRPPKKVLSEVSRSSGMVRDMLSGGLDTIITDSREIYDNIHQYMEDNLPEKLNVLTMKRPRQGLFQHYGIERQIKGAFGKSVNLPNGAYLVIEHTEALHSIDVNSGSLHVKNNSPEETALQINLDAAREIARQLRLRDMGGIVVIDFIDQRKNENRKAIYNRLKQEMEKDRAKHAILPMSRFGLIQLTRQRVRPEVNIQTEESCPNCGGTGKQRPAILLADEVEKNIEYLLRKNQFKGLKLVMNPYLAAYFQKGVPSKQMKWFFRYGKWINLLEDNAAPFMEVRYFDKDDEEIKLD